MADAAPFVRWGRPHHAPAALGGRRSQLALALPPKVAPKSGAGWVPKVRELAWYRDASEGGRWAAILVYAVQGSKVTGQANVGQRTFELGELFERPLGSRGGRR